MLLLEARASEKSTSALVWQLVLTRCFAPAPIVWSIFLLYAAYAALAVSLLQLFYPAQDGTRNVLALTAITLLGSAVFLMVGYRLNASYDRWYVTQPRVTERRLTVTSAVCTCRYLARLCRRFHRRR